MVYLSGPMSSLPQLNFPAFHEAAARLRALGYEVVNPAELDEADAEPKQWADYLRRDIAELVKCDALVLLPGWENSRGARLERFIACELGMRVRTLDAALSEEPAPRRAAKKTTTRKAKR